MATRPNDEAEERQLVLRLIKDECVQGELQAAICIRPRDRSSAGHILAILKGLEEGLEGYSKETQRGRAFILAVDQNLFEGDVSRSLLGELVAGWLINDHVRLYGLDFLWRNEVLFKKRKILDSIGDLCLEYSQLASELLIPSSYFRLDYVQKNARIYPPSIILYENLVHEQDAAPGSGYSEAIRQLVHEGVLLSRDDYLSLDPDFVRNTQHHQHRAINFLRMVDRTLGHYLPLKAIRAKPVLDLYKEISEYYAAGSIEGNELLFEDPRRYLHLQTSSQRITLDRERGIGDFIAQANLPGETSNYRVERIGSLLNDVYLVRFAVNDREEKLIAKKYRNWTGLKWFPLAVWALGTQDFSVLGKTRLGNEVAVSNMLSRQGIPAPKVRHVAPSELLLIREFIEGENQVRTVKNVLSGSDRHGESSRLKIMGSLVAQAHYNRITIGDCKPENFIFNPKQGMFVVDLEQGGYRGNAAWDLAELLYYSGHYASIVTEMENVATMVRSMVDGYLSSGGEPDIVRSIGGLRYTKVFSLFTLPLVIYTTVKTCEQEASR